MSVEAATDYVEKMVLREYAQTRSLPLAMKSLSRKHKIGFWQLSHFWKKRAKSCDTALFVKIKQAYLEHCASQLAALRHELDVEASAGNDDNQDLAAEIAALVEKIEAQRTALRQGGALK